MQAFRKMWQLNCEKYRVNARGRRKKYRDVGFCFSIVGRLFFFFLNIESVSISVFLNIAISVSLSINRPTSNRRDSDSLWDLGYTSSRENSQTLFLSPSV